MADKEDKKKEKGLFGGLFTGIEKLVELASGLKDGETKTVQRESDLSGRKAVFGFSINTLAGRKPVVETFGNIKKTSKGLVVKKERAPVADVFDEKDEIKIYAEMPGIMEADINVHLKGTILDISAQSGERTYHDEFLLSDKIKPETLKFNYKNGILEIIIKKTT